MNHFVLVQSFPFNLDIQTINQIKDFISREVYLLHQIVCSRKVFVMEFDDKKIKKELEYETTTYSSSNICY